MTENISPHAVVCVLGLTLRDFGQQPVARQARSKTALERLIETVIASVPATERVVLDAPDGAVVVSLQAPDDVLGLAERAQKLAPPDLSLCLSVNYGPVGVATAEGQAEGLFGDGISAALTLANAAQPGHFLVSRSFQEKLTASGSERANDLSALGTHTDANVRTHEVFALDSDAGHDRRRRYFIKSALAVTGIVAAGIAARVVRLELLARPAVVHLQIKPSGEIWVDGELKGSSPPLSEFELSPGAHAIEVRRTGQPPLKMNVNLKPEEKIAITHTFASPKKKEEGFIDGLRRRLGGS